MMIMKNILLILFPLILFSCKKDYTCVCKDADGTPFNIPLHDTKRKVQKECSDYNNHVYNGVGITCGIE
jgi:hypothetical protein